jgi:hypothetical protein
MKGFLHRIANSVVRPQQAVHPFVESIYPAARGERAAEVLTAHEKLSASARTGMSLKGAPSEVAPKDLRSSITPSVSTLGERKELRATANEHPSFPLLLPKHGPEIPDPVQHVGQIEGDASSLSTQSRVAPRQEQEGSEFVPIVVDHVSRADSADASRLPALRTQGEIEATVARGNTRRQAAQIPASSRSVPQQSDDIQIHIGRIEVVAVPPPAPRPATAPVRKGLSLDEYLSRKNGGAR